MKSTRKIYEYRLDRWDEGTIIIDSYDNYFVGRYPHALTQFLKRVKKFEYKLLGLPTTESQLLAKMDEQCSTVFSQLASLNIKKTSLKGLYTQIRPINVKKGNTVVATVYVELTVMFNASKPAFGDQELFDQIWDMRYGRVNWRDRNQFLRDHATSEWQELIDNGTVRENKVAIFLESAVVALSDDAKYPVSWSNVKLAMDRVEDRFPAVDMNLSTFQKMWYSVQNDESKSQVKSLLSPLTLLKLGVKPKG